MILLDVHLLHQLFLFLLQLVHSAHQLEDHAKPKRNAFMVIASSSASDFVLYGVKQR